MASPMIRMCFSKSETVQMNFTLHPLITDWVIFASTWFKFLALLSSTLISAGLAHTHAYHRILLGNTHHIWYMINDISYTIYHSLILLAACSLICKCSIISPSDGKVKAIESLAVVVGFQKSAVCGTTWSISSDWNTSTPSDNQIHPDERSKVGFPTTAWPRRIICHYKHASMHI